MQIMCRSLLSPLLIGVLLFITVFAQASKHTPPIDYSKRALRCQTNILNNLIDLVVEHFYVKNKINVNAYKYIRINKECS